MVSINNGIVSKQMKYVQTINRHIYKQTYSLSLLLQQSDCVGICFPNSKLKMISVVRKPQIHVFTKWSWDLLRISNYEYSSLSEIIHINVNIHVNCDHKTFCHNLSLWPKQMTWIMIVIFENCCVIKLLMLTDINECEMFDNVCEGGGLCVNTQGSFRCNCPPGLILDATGRRCIGTKGWIRLKIYHNWDGVYMF